VKSLEVIVGVASQASVAVAGLKTGVAGQLIGVVCATQVMVGATLSTTDTVFVQVEEQPDVPTVKVKV
jgi:hypothetical protein